MLLGGIQGDLQGIAQVSVCAEVWFLHGRLLAVGALASVAPLHDGRRMDVDRFLNLWIAFHPVLPSFQLRYRANHGALSRVAFQAPGVCHCLIGRQDGQASGSGDLPQPSSQFIGPRWAWTAANVATPSHQIPDFPDVIPCFATTKQERHIAQGGGRGRKTPNAADETKNDGCGPGWARPLQTCPNMGLRQTNPNRSGCVSNRRGACRLGQCHCLSVVVRPS